MSPDVIVIGAGIVGAACAHELARSGVQVLVLDGGFGGATGAGMGHLVLMDDTPAEFALTRASLELWNEWVPRLPADCDFTRCGTLWVAADEEEMQAASERAQRLRAHGVSCELLGARQLADTEPMLRAGLAGALEVTGDAVVYAPNAARWMVTKGSPNVSFETAEVTAIDGREVHTADGRSFSAGAVVLAAGTRAAGFLPGLPIRPKKGHLAITDRYPGLVRHQLVELGYIKSAHHSPGPSVAFNVQPRPTGQLLIGSSREFDNVDPSVDLAMLAKMLRQAMDYLPGLRDLNVIRTWTGFRAATPDGLPIIGAHPRVDGLWLAIGHEGLGVTTAPGTASLLAALIAGSTPPFDPGPYSPARFAELS